MIQPFPWKLWLGLNAVLSVGLAWFIATSTLGETVLVGLLITIPANAVIIVQWARGRDLEALHKGSRVRRIKVILSCGVVVITAFCVYYYYLGESIDRVLLVGIFTLLLGFGPFALRLWLQKARKSSGDKVHPDLPNMM